MTIAGIDYLYAVLLSTICAARDKTKTIDAQSRAIDSGRRPVRTHRRHDTEPSGEKPCERRTRENVVAAGRLSVDRQSLFGPCRAPELTRYDIIYTRPCDRGEWNDSGRRETATRPRLPRKRRHHCTCTAAPAAACTIPTDPTPVVGSPGSTDACFWASGGRLRCRRTVGEQRLSNSPISNLDRFHLIGTFINAAPLLRCSVTRSEIFPRTS